MRLTCLARGKNDTEIIASCSDIVTTSITKRDLHQKHKISFLGATREV